MTTDSLRARAVLRERGVTQPLDLGIVLGTGLGSIADELTDAIIVPYADLPGFPSGHVSGHVGQLAVGRLGGLPVAIMQGRAHYYEAGNPAAMASPLRTLAALGVGTMMLTNSAGSVQPGWTPGTLALIADHINVSGLNPLIGATADDRFVPLANAYDADLRSMLRAIAIEARIEPLHEGTYMWFAGPSFETPAEVRVAKLLGADLVGMSTVPETILARQMGLRVAAVSVITNFATGISGGDPNHAETKAVARLGSDALRRLTRGLAERLSQIKAA
ncbi:purine-nucleoside phosphorylase [Lichenihabitans sp. PAMC28606]|uniref:purine-nucleoside phosphorylase n=1 Tax=Lichenihabitans sp. PAMC28606 TaxID=2880932 RepID=UPI001D0B86F9|nr:purine-nucleoside phosphorylase [Lichenihabitans sp. PAMC28606]UDL96097.1 purine-nucleoside phosphorylase [Lichenihabitans sp. PAMC28606]